MYELFITAGYLLGFGLILVFGWLFTIVIVAALALHKKKNVLAAVKPLLDEF